jgi:xylan 1,4-beta-xylosidase
LSGAAQTLTVWKVDGAHADAYAAWRALGSPQSPDEATYAKLQTAARLQPAETPRAVAVANGRAKVSLALPRQGVALLELSPMP